MEIDGVKSLNIWKEEQIIQLKIIGTLQYKEN